MTDELAAWVVENSPNQAITLLMLNVILLLLGMMMNDLSGTVLSAGLLWPIAAAAGVNPYHFAAITGVNLGLGHGDPANCADALFGWPDREKFGRRIHQTGPGAHVGRHGSGAAAYNLLAGSMPVHPKTLGFIK